MGKSDVLNIINLYFLYLKNKLYDIILQPLGFSSTPLGKDRWLIRFIEADLSFKVRTSFNTKVSHIYLRFELVQSRSNHYGYSTFDIMNQIAVFLGVNLNEIRSHR